MEEGVYVNAGLEVEAIPGKVRSAIQREIFGQFNRPTVLYKSLGKGGWEGELSYKPYDSLHSTILYPSMDKLDILSIPINPCLVE